VGKSLSCLLAFVLAGSAATLARGATTTARSSGLFSKPTNSDWTSWGIFAPTAADTISWSSGTNEADGTTFPYTTYGPEKYFSFPGAIGRTFTGFTRNSPGPRGSVSRTSGSGSSYYNIITVTGTLGPVTGTVTASVPTASWTVNATGTLGTAPASYYSDARAMDPQGISDLSNIGGGSTMDLMYLGEISSASYGNGSVSYDLSYNYMNSSSQLTSVDLVNITASASGGVSVTGDAPSYLTIDEMTDLGGNNFVLAPTTLTALKGQLTAEFLANNFTPLDLAFLLNGVDVPTQTLSDGNYVEFDATSEADDNAATPLPASVWGGLGLIAVLALSRRRILARR
jgi:hypothetical protein